MLMTPVNPNTAAPVAYLDLLTETGRPLTDNADDVVDSNGSTSAVTPIHFQLQLSPRLGT